MKKQITFKQLKSLVKESFDEAPEVAYTVRNNAQTFSHSDQPKEYGTYHTDDEAEDEVEVDVDEPYRDCGVMVHSVKGDREYGFKHFKDIGWFDSKEDMQHWLKCGCEETDGAEQDRFYSMLNQLERGIKVVDYNEVYESVNEGYDDPIDFKLVNNELDQIEATVKDTRLVLQDLYRDARYGKVPATRGKRDKVQMLMKKIRELAYDVSEDMKD